MDDLRTRRAAAIDNRDGNRHGRFGERPDRVALWAVVLAVVAMLAGVASAKAGSSGGIGGGGGAGGGTQSDSGTPGCPEVGFGSRTLREGDCGDDVETLNWILKSKDGQAPLVDAFQALTTEAVRSFQREAGLGADGVVDPRTTSALARSLPRQRATWYGPGFFGNRTACGQRLKTTTFGVAHRTLPCGSKVVLRYKGRYVRTRVIDRGPFANGAKWDLTQATAEAIGFEYTDDVRVAKVGR